jgi:hypothetical protein
VQVIANTCPAALGVAVYKARAIAARYAPSAQYSDNAACDGYLSQNKLGIGMYDSERYALLQPWATMVRGDAISYTVYPNPLAAEGSLIVMVKGDHASTCSASLQDVMGRSIPISTAAAGSSLHLQLPKHMHTGIYYLRLQAITGFIVVHKIEVN